MNSVKVVLLFNSQGEISRVYDFRNCLNLQRSINKTGSSIMFELVLEISEVLKDKKEGYNCITQ